MIECKRSAMSWVVREPAGAGEFARLLGKLSTLLSERGYGRVEVLIVTLDGPAAARQAAREIGYARVLGAEDSVVALTQATGAHEKCH